MRDLADKIDNTAPAGTGRLSAAEFNSDQHELENAVTSAGITLDAGAGPDTDASMLAQSLARYATGGVFGTDSGAANTYVVSAMSPTIGSTFVVPKALFDGMCVIFYPGHSNTGASTLNAWGLGVKPLVNHLGAALVGSEVIVSRLVAAFYSVSAGAYKLAPWANALLFGGGGGGTVTFNGLTGNRQVYDVAGTYNFTVPAGVTSIVGHCWGAGGAGGDSYAPGTTGNTGGGGGAGGGYAVKLITVTPAQVIPLTVGAGGTRVAGAQGNTGGTSSISSYCSATGGPGGINGSNSALGIPGSTYGGGGVGGDLNLYGSSGGVAIPVTPAIASSAGGFGGQAPGLAGAPSGTYGASSVGKNGAGGNGAGAGGTTARAGGNGGPGLVVIEW